MAGGDFNHLMIDRVSPTGRVLGSGGFGSVIEVDWNGTVCAAKQLHGAVLESVSPEDVEGVMRSFQHECRTWAKLRHPNIVQFLGIFYSENSSIPWLVLEKLNTSLRVFLDQQAKGDFMLTHKVAVLDQIAQALSYLHSHHPPLVHHDLTTNNILLSERTYTAKITDFGMTRGLTSSSSFLRTSTVKGTMAFLAPEMFLQPPKYNEKLDVFSFGNIVLHTITHKWPEPLPSTQYNDGILVALNEFQRRQGYLKFFTAQENSLFQVLIQQCLRNIPEQRPDSQALIEDTKGIQSEICSDFPSEVSSADMASGMAKATLLVEKVQSLERELRDKSYTCVKLKQENDSLRQAVESLKQSLKKKDETIMHLQEELKNQADQLITSSSNIQRTTDEDFKGLTLYSKAFKGTMGDCEFESIAISENNALVLIGVTDETHKQVHLFTPQGNLVNSFGSEGSGKGEFKGWMCGVAFSPNGNILVSDTDNQRVQMFSNTGDIVDIFQLDRVHTDDELHPYGITIHPSDNRIYVADATNHAIFVFHEEGYMSNKFGQRGAEKGQLFKPWDVDMSSDGLLFVADRGNSRVQVFRDDGTFVSLFPTESEPCCLTVMPSSHIVVTTGWNANILVYTNEGELVHKFGTKGNRFGLLGNVHGIASDKNGLLYVADRGNKQIAIF